MFKQVLHVLPHSHPQWLKNHTWLLPALSKEQKRSSDGKGIVLLLDQDVSQVFENRWERASLRLGIGGKAPFNEEGTSMAWLIWVNRNSLTTVTGYNY